MGVTLLLLVTAAPHPWVATHPAPSSTHFPAQETPASTADRPSGLPDPGAASALPLRTLAAGTPTWTDLSATAGAPPPRISGGLVYDGEDGYTILFGGEYLNTTTLHETYYNDTWEFSGGVWTNITSTPSPSPRFGFGVAFDPLDGEVFLFGGRNAAGFALNDTWEFSGGRWTNLSIGQAPSPRFWPSMAYDSQTDNIVLFGGVSPTSTDLNDTWTYSLGTWTQATPVTHPPSRHGAALMDDPQTSDVVLFGGLGAEYYNTTWQWSGTNWSDITAAADSSISPDGRVGPGGAFDAALNAEVMYGGYPANDYPYGTWLLSNGSWTLYNNLPGSPPSDTVWDQFTYDAADEWIVYFVPNSNETFVFNETSGGGTGGLQVTASASPLTGVVPLTVTLSATISGGTPPYNVTWSLGTGSSLYAANTSTTYTTPGTYNLTLTVHDSASGHYFSNWTVDVSAPPLQADASALPTLAIVGQSISFTATYSGGWPPYAFGWAFGDGGHATTQNATHAYTSAATFDVSFEITAGLGGSLFVNFTENVTASLPPFAVVATAAPTSGVAPVTVTTSSTPSGGEPPYAYRWAWGDGGAPATAENASHTYATAGSYLLSLNVSDFTGASIDKTWTVTVTPAVSVTISASPLYTSVGDTVTFTSTPAGGTAPYTYAWTFGDGLSATTRNASHTFSTAAVFVVYLTVKDATGSSASASLAVTVNTSAPAASGQPGGFTATDWIALIVIVLVIATLIAVVVTRRRKKQPPAVGSPTGASP